MTLTRRLLMAGGGAGGFTIPAERDRWVRQGAVLTATETWEGLGILEPSVIYESGFKMWYRGGGLHGPNSRVGYATSSDGLSWSKLGTSAILGDGAGGESNRVICPNVRKFGSTYYVYYSEIDTTVLKCAASANGTSGFALTDTGLALPTGCLYFGNVSVWLDGSTYKALVEAYHDPSSLWKTYYATSSAIATGWSLGNSGNPLTTLSVGGMWGGPDVQTINGRLESWYHAAVSGNTPTDIYRAHSTDAITWTQIAANPVLTHTGSAFEIDQIADPCVLEVSGASYMFYDADDNGTDIAAIKLATFAGTLASLVVGS